MTIRPVIPLLFCAWLSACSGGGDAGLPTGPLTQIETDRESLTALVPHYLAALVAHDTSRVPVAENAVFVENAQRLRQAVRQIGRCLRSEPATVE